MQGDKDWTLSVIIPNFNYAQFLSAAIDSVLSQASERVEIIVVDDCSTDDSRTVIERYGDKVSAIFHEKNAGQGAAFNSGFARAKNDLIMFLDADDFLLAGSVDMVLDNAEPDVAIYHYRMRLADLQGNLSDLYPPEQREIGGSGISERLRSMGRYDGTVTSGLVFSRDYLARVMPMDGEAFRQGGDGYLSAVVPLYGSSRAFQEPISGYRQHSANHSAFSQNLVNRAKWKIAHDEERYAAIRTHSQRLGLPVAADLGLRDTVHLEQLMILSLFGHDADLSRRISRTSVADRALSSIGKGIPTVTRWVQYLWWIMLKTAPEFMARTLIQWKLDKTSRPKLVSAFSRLARTRLGVVIR